ncbi:MAG: TGS domain-containing protein, partial [Gammaproteobacteria bacterium]|nr:TGS domain-containing protein [Gammaproteobacteria bacterium]
HLYSIYRKMREKHLSFNEVMDVFAFRVVVDKVDSCYRVLGVVHNLYTPVPGKFKDYIAIPKVNGYQSLHTVLFSPYSVPIEVQIRTEDMDKVAEAGIAAHWLYKTKEGSANASTHTRARQWLGGLLEMQQNAGNPVEFLENVKIDLFPDEVYVFTPTGEIREMPRGATAVDFAYAVHTDIGNHCVAVKIDRRLMPLRSELHNGQTVEIITAKGTRPNPAWLDFVVTAKARTTIRHFLKNLKRSESISLGQRLLEKSLAAYNTTFKKLKRKHYKPLLKEYGLRNMSALLEEIGMGNRIPALVARGLMTDADNKSIPVIEHDINHPLMIKGTEGAVVTLAKCCRPIPGDPILGFVTAGRGIVVHTQTCNNTAEFRKLPEKWIDVQWDEQPEGDFPVDLRLLVANQRGVLATVAATISDMGANIENVNMEARDGLHTSLSFTVTVHGRQHLAHVMRSIRGIDQVERISRLHK